MKALRVRIERGQIVGKAPAGIPEGTELDLCLAEPDDEMTQEQLTALNRVLDAGWRSIEQGRFRPASEVIQGLRTAQ